MKFKVVLDYIMIDEDCHNIEIEANSLEEACKKAEGIAEGWDSPATWDATYAEVI